MHSTAQLQGAAGRACASRARPVTAAACRSLRRAVRARAVTDEEAVAQAVKSVENATAGVESAAAKAQDVQDAQDAQEVKALFTEKVEELGEAWAATEDKPAIITLGMYAFISLWIVAGVLKGLDALPLVPDFFQLVGVVYSSWFTYRYLLYKEDREELKRILADFKASVLK